MTHEPMNIGFIGTQHVHALGLASILQTMGHNVTGAFERDEAARTVWSDRGAGPLLERDAVIDAADALIICGTNAERADDSIAALEAGKPVLSEKPLAVSADELARVEAAAAGGRFMVALPIRFARAMQSAKQAIRAGHIGTPLGARGTNHGVFPGLWFADPVEAGGGAIMDHTVHLSDGLCWLFDDQIESIYAVAGTKMHDLPTEDCAVMTVDFRSGIFASIDASWSRPQSYENWGNVWVEVAGSEGRIIIDPLARHMTVYDDNVGKQRIGYFGDNMSEGLLEAFVDYARNGGDSPVSIADGVHATETCFAAYRSVDSGQPEAITAH